MREGKHHFRVIYMREVADGVGGGSSIMVGRRTLKIFGEGKLSKALSKLIK